MEIRPATVDDAAAYCDHMKRHFAESGKDGDFPFHPVLDYESWEREEQIAKTMEAWTLEPPVIGWQKAWLAWDNGRVVADCMLRSSMLVASAHRCQYGIGIERGYRGKGLGRQLSMLAITWAKLEPTLVWMDLWVFAHNAPAIRLYENLGFKPLAAIQDQFRINKASIDDIHMGLKIKP